MSDEPKLNYFPGSESFSGGMLVGSMRSQAAAATGRPYMLADNAKGRAIVERLIQEGRSIESATLGLDDDWDCNSTTIYDGKFHDYDAHEGSLWATPTLIVLFTDRPSEAYECWSLCKAFL